MSAAPARDDDDAPTGDYSPHAARKFCWSPRDVTVEPPDDEDEDAGKALDPAAPDDEDEA